MLQNEYLLAKIGFDTAENENSTFWQMFGKCLMLAKLPNMINYANIEHLARSAGRRGDRRDEEAREGVRLRVGVVEVPMCWGTSFGRRQVAGLHRVIEVSASDSLLAAVSKSYLTKEVSLVCNFT